MKRLFEEPPFWWYSCEKKVCNNCSSNSILEDENDNTETCEDCGIEKNTCPSAPKRGSYSEEEIYTSLKYQENKLSIEL